MRFINTYKPDLVHTFFPVGNIIGVCFARIAGTKNIVSSRRDYGEWMNTRYLLATRLANRCVTKIVGNSLNSVKQLTIAKEKIGADRVDVVYNGINLDLFHNIRKVTGFKKVIGIPDSHNVIGIVANFRPMKHHHTFIRAASEVLKISRNVSFVLVGTGFGKSSTKESTEELARSLGIEKNVYFVGPQREKLFAFLAIFDIGVNCSAEEGLSNAVMEYMAAGIPCIVSEAGGNPDLIVNGVHGYTYPLDDYMSLANLILGLIKDEELRKRFVKNARIKIEKEMGMGSMLARYEALYTNIVGA